MMLIHCKLCKSLCEGHDVETQEATDHAKQHFQQMQIIFMDKNLVEDNVFVYCFAEEIKPENNGTLAKDKNSEILASSVHRNDKDATR